ncbi:hypothetical protein FRX31_028074 [Thalictrum thalictroides]|uniref:Uncharacterized protein n=1 Tax=Thalictrum thalictroides TaxID=46969 RepID=A0A7J6VDM8_THATH|nr:hypothetical protein FRX31_028074 [Thalictrum thalictroides]
METQVPGGPKCYRWNSLWFRSVKALLRTSVFYAGFEPATSGVTDQDSNQLSDLPPKRSLNESSYY